MNNGKIYEFDPVIYPSRLWVSVMPDFKTADKTFYFLDDNEEVVDNAKESHNSAIATTFAVAHKNSGWKCSFFVIWRKSQCGTGICAHEATHVYDWLDKQFGLNCQEYGNDEPRAYFVQWIANCIDKVLRNKVK